MLLLLILYKCKTITVEVVVVVVIDDEMCDVFEFVHGVVHGHCKTRKLLLASGMPASTTLAATTTRGPPFETPIPTQRATKKTATAPTNKAIEISTEGFN